MNELYRRRRDLVCDALAQAGVEVARPKGTIYVWAPIPAGFESSAAYCEHVLEEAAVVISPGDAYGPSGAGFFRISLTTPDDRLPEAVDRLRRLLDEERRARTPGYHHGVQRSRHGGQADVEPQTGAPRGRARQRAYLIATLRRGHGTTTSASSRELLRTAGVAGVGELVQHRQHPHPNSYLGPGKLEELKDELAAARTRTSWRATTSSPRARSATSRPRWASGDRPDRDHPRHLRLARPHRGGQAPGRARPTRVQPGADAGPVVAPGAARRGRIDGGIGTRGPGETQIETDRRLARDRISALRRKLPHVQASREVMRAERERAAAAAGRARRLHERRQVDTAQRDDRCERRRRRAAVPDARPDDARAARRWAQLLSRTPSASSASCPTSSWTRSARRSRRPGWPI